VEVGVGIEESQDGELGLEDRAAVVGSNWQNV
jgi:hypothetical protein